MLVTVYYCNHTFVPILLIGAFAKHMCKTTVSFVISLYPHGT